MDAFIKKWLGKRVDFDAAYGYQCVDLVKQYIRETTGLKPGSWGNAIDYWTKTNPTLLTKFDKVNGSAVQPGDIVIFTGLAGNPYGHIALATGKLDSSSVEVLEQNGATGKGSGTGGDAIRLRSIARSRVAGLLRRKAVAPAAPATLSKSLIGKTVHLSASVPTWRVYKPGTHTVAGTLLPKQNGGLDYIIRGIDTLPNRVLVNSAAFGSPVSLPIDKDATIK